MLHPPALMPRSASPAESAVAFQAGTLCLAKGLVEMRITGSPVPRSVMRRGREGNWEPFVPEFRLVHPYRPARRAAPVPRDPGPQLCFDFGDAPLSAKQAPLTPARQRKRAFEQFRFSLPKPVAHLLEPYRTHQWSLLMLLHWDDGAIELARSNPALAYALAQKMAGDRELIAALRVSRMRQRDILEVLGLPASPVAVQLFKKVNPVSLSGDNWPALIDRIREAAGDSKSRLRHLPSINAGILEILHDPRAARAAGPALLEEVARDRAEAHRGRIVHLITSTLRMQEELRTRDRCDRFQNLARLRSVHDAVAEQYRRRVRQLTEANAAGPACFQTPPLPGIPGQIEPITSPAELVDEGELQGNCVASYAGRVRDGDTYIYRVLRPERATLSLVRRSPLSDWEIGELEGRYNTDVSDATEEIVRAWLERNHELV